MLLAATMVMASWLEPPKDLAPDFHEGHTARVVAGLQVRAAHNAMLSDLYRAVGG